MTLAAPVSAGDVCYGLRTPKHSTALAKKA
jgi:hypothetical protein